MGEKSTFGGRNEEYPLEDSRVNTQEGPKKVDVPNHPGSRYQGNKKHPRPSLQHPPPPQVVAEGSDEDGPCAWVPASASDEGEGPGAGSFPAAT